MFAKQDKSTLIDVTFKRDCSDTEQHLESDTTSLKAIRPMTIVTNQFLASGMNQEQRKEPGTSGQETTSLNSTKQSKASPRRKVSKEEFKMRIEEIKKKHRMLREERTSEDKRRQEDKEMERSNKKQNT